MREFRDRNPATAQDRNSQAGQQHRHDHGGNQQQGGDTDDDGGGGDEFAQSFHRKAPWFVTSENRNPILKGYHA